MPGCGLGAHAGKESETAVTGGAVGKPAAQRQSDPAVTIAAVRATPFRLQYATPIVLSDGIRESAEHLLVQVTSSEGVVVIETMQRGPSLQKACGVVERVLSVQRRPLVPPALVEV